MKKTMDEIANEFIKELKKKREKMVKFEKSKRFTDISIQLKKELLNNGGFITDNVYEEKFLFGNVSNKEFCLFFDSAIETEKLEASANHGFPSSFVIKNGIKFEMVYGQGTAYICSLVKKTKRKKNK
jgi:hypothetical protein